MRALVALTIFMGVLIVAGLAVIIVTIVHRVSAPKPEMAAVTAAAGAPGHATVALPPGAGVLNMTGVGDKLVLHIATPQGGDELITLDPATGAVIETIDLVPQAPPDSK
jgi:hypothetical protein